MTLGRLVKLSAAGSLALFLALAVLSKGWLEPDGMLIFDSRLAGYGLAEANTYLGALEAGQKQLYLGWFRWLDTVFPALLTFCLAGVVWGQARGVHPAMRLSLMIIPAAYLVMDLAENALVAEMLRSAALDADTVGRASGFTIAKWGFLALSLGLCVWAWRWAPKQRARGGS
ncbi:hypothetical protein JQT66_09585 [Sulfitobacter mediterraneus]|uniref:hypothetical protein n=1 Tax=Sulfitobacter mediterraneus TaxID=83219 RepID=UPI0019336C80|nr:hypothetical protein [Sulfitobacter mediterraneus]MBM1310415.1 hypothetical protein [Sulfitobacter mediterraneus]MBM1314299.1 hypothetical protein [Sulfitobacter mediterraneus]MBM1322659.1 hypothetical protein [Sulfitobacter mediterraneus]MBM1326571.1 hypothetical protein [Sulfitobacter mediterraneus]MBM1397917.1 hypothetical protein [Sulfitobacter mediterraneus]